MITRNWALHTRLEEHDTDVKSFVRAYLLRPWILLITERIFLVVTIYMAFVYSLLFLFFEGFPIAFVEVRGWEPRIGSLLFLWLVIGKFRSFGVRDLLLSYRFQTRIGTDPLKAS